MVEHTETEIAISKEDLVTILTTSVSLDQSYLGKALEVVDGEPNIGIGYLFTSIVNAVDNIEYEDDCDSDQTWEEDWDDKECELCVTANELIVETYYDKEDSQYKYITYPANDDITNLDEYFKTLTKYNVFNFSPKVKEVYKSLYNDKVVFNYTSGQFSNTEIYCIGFLAPENTVHISIIDIISHTVKQYAVEFRHATEIKSTDIFVIKLVPLSESKLGLVYSYGPKEVDPDVTTYNDSRACIILNEDLTKINAVIKIADIIKHINK